MIDAYLEDRKKTKIRVERFHYGEEMPRFESRRCGEEALSSGLWSFLRAGNELPRPPLICGQIMILFALPVSFSR
jgi:hypothetical protein